MKNEKWIIYLLAALNFTHIMDFMIMMPMGEILMKTFSLRPDQFTFLVSSYTISAAASGFFASFFVDRYPRKSSLLFIYSGFVLGTIICGFADNYHFLLITRGLTGIFGGIMGAQVMAIVTDLVPYERRGKAIGMLMSAFSAASVVGVPFGLYLATHYNWYFPFFLIGGIGLILIFPIIKLLPKLDGHLSEGRPPVNPVKTFKEVFSTQNNRIALLQTFMITCAHFMIIPFITPFMIRNVGFEQSDIIYIYMVGGIATVFMSPFIGKMIDKYNAKLIYYILVFAAMIPVLLLTHLPPISLIPALIVTTLFFILGGSRFIPSSTAVSGAIPPKIRGSFMSFNSCAQQLGTASASMAAGYIVFAEGNGPIQGYGLTGIIASLLSLATLLIIPRLKLYKAV
jgi:MFS transporter, DHA1 family, inner membrane transport protein